MGEKMCSRCGHPDHWHRHDDADNVPATDPGCKFRCIGYDCEQSGKPVIDGCDCPDFKEAA